jgi:hypothetical protein|tara:strand:+ start:42 stop:203 length:162 start_codon:yes stop_codon:yes gene_type:complete
MKKTAQAIKKFCLIQLQIITNREVRIRKDLQDCLLQREFLTQILAELPDDEIQ